MINSINRFIAASSSTKAKKEKRELTPDAIKKLRKFLEPVQEEHPYLNRGGCGFFADALKTQLEKQGFKPSFYVISNMNVPKMVANRTDNSLQSIINAGASLYHIMCKIGDYLVDSTGIYKRISDTGWGHGLGDVLEKDEVVKGWLKEKGVWNTSFNQDELPRVFEKVKKIKL